MSEICKGIKKSKLVVINKSQEYTMQQREYSQ